MGLLGYTCVSDAGQDAAVQSEALMSAGVDALNIFSDVAPPKRAADRPGMRRLLDTVEEGETVVVWRIDLLGRSLSEVLDTVAMMVGRGLDLVSVQDGIDSRTTTGRLMVDLIVSLSQYERHLTGERVAAGMSSARRAGTRLGRPPLDSLLIRDKVRAVEDARARGLSAADAARLVGWSRATFYRHQKEHGSQE
nr:recombinase family protein [Propionicimonas sp.]